MLATCTWYLDCLDDMEPRCSPASSRLRASAGPWMLYDDGSGEGKPILKYTYTGCTEEGWGKHSLSES